MQKRRFVSTRTLQSGMRIDQAIVDATGRDLIRRGAFLDDFQIEYLREKGVAGIYIVEGEPDPEDLLGIHVPEYTKKVVEKARVEDRSKVVLNESIKKLVGEGIQYLFSNPDSDSFVEATDNIANELANTILANDAVAVDVNILKCNDEYTFKHSVDVATIAMIIFFTIWENPRSRRRS